VPLLSNRRAGISNTKLQRVAAKAAQDRSTQLQAVKPGSATHHERAGHTSASVADGSGRAGSGCLTNNTCAITPPFGLRQAAPCNQKRFHKVGDVDGQPDQGPAAPILEHRCPAQSTSTVLVLSQIRQREGVPSTLKANHLARLTFRFGRNKPFHQRGDPKQRLRSAVSSLRAAAHRATPINRTTSADAAADQTAPSRIPPAMLMGRDASASQQTPTAQAL